jgi:DNA-binding transcriptional MocR family regulator
VNTRQEWRHAIRDSGLPASTKLVGFVLDTYMSADGVAWPARRTLAADCGIGLRTVDRAITHLRAAGLLTVRKGRGRGLVNFYQAKQSVDNSPVKGGSGGNSEKKKAPQTTKKGDTTAPQKKSRTRTRARARETNGIPERVQVDQAMLEIAQGWLTQNPVVQ